MGDGIVVRNGPVGLRGAAAGHECRRRVVPFRSQESLGQSAVISPGRRPSRHAGPLHCHDPGGSARYMCRSGDHRRADK